MIIKHAALYLLKYRCITFDGACCETNAQRHGYCQTLAGIKGSCRAILHEDILYTLRSTGDRLSPTACKYEFRRKLRSHSCSVDPVVLLIVVAFESRTLLEEYILELESHVGRIFVVYLQTKHERNQLLRAPGGVGRRNSMPVDEGSKG